VTATGRAESASVTGRAGRHHSRHRHHNHNRAAAARAAAARGTRRALF